MRDVLIKGLDREFHYRFGPDIDVLCAVMSMPNRRNPMYLVTEVELSGEELIAFINEKAPSARHLIPDIAPEGRYMLIGYDD